MCVYIFLNAHKMSAATNFLCLCVTSVACLWQRKRISMYLPTKHCSLQFKDVLSANKYFPEQLVCESHTDLCPNNGPGSEFCSREIVRLNRKYNLRSLHMLMLSARTVLSASCTRRQQLINFQTIWITFTYPRHSKCLSAHKTIRR